MEFGVYRTGGSIGEKRTDPVKTFPTQEEAKAFAERRNAQLTQGEKGYYKMKYIVKQMNSFQNGVAKAEQEIMNKANAIGVKFGNGVADSHQLKILKDTVKNPSKGLFLGGPTAEEAEKILRSKFGFSDKQIQDLKG